MEVWPSRCTALAKKQLLYAGPFGPAAWLCGTIFIDRLNHEKAKGTLTETARKIRDNKVCVKNLNITKVCLEKKIIYRFCSFVIQMCCIQQYSCEILCDVDSVLTCCWNFRF